MVLAFLARAVGHAIVFRMVEDDSLRETFDETISFVFMTAMLLCLAICNVARARKRTGEHHQCFARRADRMMMFVVLNW